MHSSSAHSASSERAFRRRVVALAAVLLLTISACGGATDSGLPSARPTGPLAEVDFRALPPVEEITFVSAAEAELELIAQMRADAGFAELLGIDGEAIIESLDEAYLAQGETVLPLFVTELGVDLEAASLAIAALPGSPIDRPPAARTEWSGSLLGQVSGTVGMTMGLMTQVISRAAESGSGSLTRTETYTKTPAPGLTETIEITTSYRMEAGDGRVSADIEIESHDLITDANGAQIASLDGTGHGHIDVSACPAPDGQAEGTYTLEWQENVSGAGGSGSSTFSNTAPFTLWDGDDAHWQRIDTTMDVSRGASGAGTPSGDWNVEATVPMTIPAQGRTVIGYDQAVLNGTNASLTQGKETVQGTYGAQLFMVEVAKEAEKFWRSGKCIELETSEESREVDPDEQISFSVDATHKFDGAQVAAPIIATFSGKETLEPANTPLDPPANFDFTAGSDPGDTGTIDLKQTSRRGIGLKTLTFNVAGGDLIVSYDGVFDVTAQAAGGFNGTFLVANVPLEGTGGTYGGSGTLVVQGSVVVGPCSAPINEQVGVTSTATLDEADSNLVHVRLRVEAGTQTVTLSCPEGLTLPYPIGSTIQLWSAALLQDVAVPIDGSTTVPAVGGAGGSTTVIVTRAEPDS